MPELAEVEFYRKRWALAATGQRIARVLLHADKRPVRHIDAKSVQETLTGARLYLPEAWVADANRCETAGIPEAERVARTKNQLAKIRQAAPPKPQRQQA